MKLFCREKRGCALTFRSQPLPQAWGGCSPPHLPESLCPEEKQVKRETAPQSKQQSATRKSSRGKACHCKQLLMQQIRDIPSTGRDREVTEAALLLPGGTGGRPQPGLRRGRFLQDTAEQPRDWAGCLSSGSVAMPLSPTRQQGPATRGPAEGGHVLWGQAGTCRQAAATCRWRQPCCCHPRAPSVAPRPDSAPENPRCLPAGLIQRV